VSAESLLGADGPFADHIPGFAPRAEQQSMAGAVETAIAQGDRLLVEAGTGVGKTYAYLVPALLSGRRVVISTGTKALQDQLFERDLPQVCAALGLRPRMALLKGRANYLCRHRLDLVEREGRLSDIVQLRELEQVRSWAPRTATGDIAELAEVPEGSRLWPRVTSTTENCLGVDCEAYADCHVVRARRAAQEADIVVINHHLFLADLALKEEGFGDLLPSADALVLDEAHQLPEVAGAFFGASLSSRQLRALGKDIIAEALRDAPDMAALRDGARALEQGVAALRLALGRSAQRQPWVRFRNKPELREARERMADILETLRANLDLAAERGRGLAACLRRVCEAQARLQDFEEAPADRVLWFESFEHGFVLHATPLEVAGLFREQMQAQSCAWVFTSATLAVGDDFEHFRLQLGLEEARSLRLDSPFDYRRNALLYMPEGLPDPNAQDYTRAVVETALPVIEASGGRCFMLFTSHRALQEAAALLSGRMDYPVLAQGRLPKREMLEQFRGLGDAVLLGTASFWEGIDVRGEALSCVIIDRLPFAAPGDPVLQARLDALRAAGGNPFMQHQLPQAVIALKQGAGRLIRDAEDRGVLVLCDPRLRRRPYGRVFLESLPPMPQTAELTEVQRFFEPVGTETHP
jgi:ATP-dependent DNA helicase DinG